MRIFRTVILAILAIIFVVIAAIVTIDGNLSSIIGYSAFKKGERLFPYTHSQMNEINWMRVQDVHETAEFERKENGIWWMNHPWNDRMDPRAAAAILQFTYSTTIVDALPINNTVKASMREFGVETSPVNITLKKSRPSGDATTLARYTLGSQAPWIAHDPEHNANFDTTYMKSNFYGRSKRILVGTGNILPLFKESVSHLRDHRPFLLAPSSTPLPNQPCDIVIKNKKQNIHLTKEALQSPWKITEPLPLPSNNEKIGFLVNKLQLLTGVKVYDHAEGILPDLPDHELTTITVRTFSNPASPVTLTIYPRTSLNSETVLATVSDRNAIFELPVKKIELNDTASLPGITDLDLDLSLLRSPYLMEIDRTKLRGISIRFYNSPFPLIVRLMEGDKNKSVSSKWLYSAEGNTYADINEEQLFDLLKTLVSCKIKNFASDSPDDLALYGLKKPSYTITLAYDDKDPANTPPLQTIFIGKGLDDSWYAMENGKPSVYQIGQDFMKVIKTDNLSWLQKKLFRFSRLELRELGLARANEEPLKLKYDYLGESWSATSGDKDVTSLINPNRARYYLDALEKINVKQWLPHSDEDAAKALEKPVFTLSITLNVPENDNKKLTVIPTPDNQTFTELPIPADTVRQETVTLQIAPMGQAGQTFYYYGKISTSPYYFILEMDAVQILGASVYER